MSDCIQYVALNAIAFVAYLASQGLYDTTTSDQEAPNNDGHQRKHNHCRVLPGPLEAHFVNRSDLREEVRRNVALGKRLRGYWLVQELAQWLPVYPVNSESLCSGSLVTYHPSSTDHFKCARPVLSSTFSKRS